MLILGRKVGERVVVPGLDVEIVVVGVQGNRVRLGVSAPVEVTIEREEKWRRRHDLVPVAGRSTQ